MVNWWLCRKEEPRSGGKMRFKKPRDEVMRDEINLMVA